MLPLLLSLALVQANLVKSPEEILQVQSVRPLPGQLDSIPVFNSNSPELVLKEGILLSTFPATGKKVTSAHLNFPFRGPLKLNYWKIYLLFIWVLFYITLVLNQ
jgi:hypothetical protein